ncbi:MAG: fused MFS/spermidine synthase [Pseudomonadota bacterium]
MRRLTYLIVTATSAGCGLVVEIAAGRMLAPYVGMSLYSWTAIIAVVLAGFSAGHWIGGRIAERPHSVALRGTIWALVGAAVTSAGALILIRLVSGPVLSWGGTTVSSILLLTTVLFFAPSFFVGIPSPILTKLAIDDQSDRMARTLGEFYAAGAFGSILGTLAAGYIFISWLGTIWTFLLVAAVYVAMAIALWAVGVPGAASQRSAVRGGQLLALIAVVFVGLGLVGERIGAFRTPCDQESSYYCIRVVDETPSRFGPARTLVLDHLAHGTNVSGNARYLLTPYVELQDALARIHSGQRSPFRAFFVGGGAFTLPRAWLAIRPDADFLVAEIDPAVTRIAADRLWLNAADPRLKIAHDDARAALLRTPRRHFDIVVGDAFHDIAVPQHLVTREFFALVASRLQPDGIYLMNVVDQLQRPRLALSITATLRTAFPVVELWRLNDSGVRTTFVVAGLQKPTPFSPINSSIRRDLSFHRLAHQRVLRLTATTDPIVLTDDYAPVDRLIGVR